MDVENEGVQVLQLFRGGFAGVAIEAKNRESRFGINAVGNWMVECASEAVFGTEQGRQLNAGRLVKKVDGGLSVFVAAGVIGDQADGQAVKGGKIVSFKNVDSVERVQERRQSGFCLRRLWIGGCFGEGVFGYCFGRQSADGAAQADDVPRFVRVIAIGQEDDEGFGEGIYPDGDAGPSAVAVGSDFKETASGAGIRRVNVPPPAASLLNFGRALVLSHLGDGLGF